MSSIKSVRLKGFAKVLVQKDVLGEDDAIEALNQAKQDGSNFIHTICEANGVDPAQVARIGSEAFGLPWIDLAQTDKESIPIELVSEKLIRRHSALPLFKRGNTLFLAMTDPSKQIVLDEIKFHTGLNTRGIIVENNKLNSLIEDALSAKENAALGEEFDDASLEDLDISSGDELPEEQDEGTDDAPIVRFVNKILLDAIHQGASDIHFEPYEHRYRVRFRVDGILSEVAHPPINLGTRIASRLKVLSQLDISERRIPQDGRFKMNLSKKVTIDFRVSTCPTVGGEKVVMRLLDPSASKLGVDKLGFFPDQKEAFLKAIHQPQGMVLVTGPTGSGKTVTLYTALNILNTHEVNISTAEDPVELKVDGINQVNMHPKAGLTFAAALRSFLRQDPDIIMVGEIRDLETAEIGIKASQTGHMVLSTLHTNSAPETLSRLVNMGVAPFNIASSVNLIIAQRLARRLCSNCREPLDVPKEALLKEGYKEADLDDLTIYGPKGCEACHEGYKGRVGLYEVLVMSPTIGELIMKGGSSLDILKLGLEEGMITIRQCGLRQVKAGLTSLTEINRVTTE